MTTHRQPTAFKQRLGDELAALEASLNPAHITSPAPVRTRPAPPLRRLRLLLAVGAVAAGAAGAVALPAAVSGEHGGSAAYAVSPQRDGTVLVQLLRPDGLPGLIRDLRALGVNAQGLHASPRGRCIEPQPASLDSAIIGRVLPTRPGDVRKLRIDPHAMPKGAVLLVVTEDHPVSLISFRVVDWAPRCVPTSVSAAPASH